MCEQFKAGQQVRLNNSSKVFSIKKIDGGLAVLDEPGYEHVSVDQLRPVVNHYHRCDWCGVLMECNDTCGEGGEFDPFTDAQGLPVGGERNPDGTFSGGHCDRDCYDHKRPRGIRANQTEDGVIVDLERGAK